MSWLIATMCTNPEKTEGCQILEAHYKAVRDALVLWIERAFDGVPLPRFSLHQAYAQMNYSTDDGTHDHRGRWQDIPDEHFRECDDAFYALGPDGIQYYLPACMCLILQDGFYPESFSLTSAWWDGEILSLLTRDQRSAICAFAFIDGDEKASAVWLRVIEEERDGRKEWLNFPGLVT